MAATLVLSLLTTSGTVATKFPPLLFEINNASSARLHKFILLSASVSVAIPILIVILFSVFIAILAGNQLSRLLS